MNDLKDFVCLTSHCKCNSKCDDCSECENEIDNWLEEHDKQIRADAIDDCIAYFSEHASEVYKHISARDFICDRLEQLKGEENE